ncbi:ROK family protein [Anaeromyxobacter paludicola]|uniref:Glucokinase n=1 Tax=Anaeromyxobacter paludicola TaxID=2918171 RepID=A0ABM7XCI6_9BACT|nr:ROK family protein [Anaeromyxobacter paludicola]BDG09587.1 glucokinase [Anaeromyxobacter paludicola]
MASLALGVDLGGTNARAAVVDRDSGEILAAHKEPLRTREPEAVVDTVAHAIQEAADAQGVSAASFGRLGVGVAGQCLGSSGVVLNAPNLGWRDVRFGELLERKLGTPVRVANDLSAAAWGEKAFGAARGISDVALVFVGSGVGSGLILGGKLHEGAYGVAGELGHMKVRPSRPGTAVRRCGCGMEGCLEAYTSGMNISARVREELAGGAASRVGALVGGDVGRVTASVVDQAFAEGDDYARALWEEVAELLGGAIANVVTLLNPARVILGGGVVLGCPQLAALTLAQFERQVSASARRGLSVERAFLGDDAGVIGAALLE